MEKPRLSIASSSSHDDTSEDGVSLPSPPVLPPVTVGSVVVGKGGTGVLHGNLTTFTVNQYLVSDWDPEAVKELVTDAVKINTETNDKFYPSQLSNSDKFFGNKEDLDGLQKKWCYLIAALVCLSFITLVSTSLFSLSSFRNVGSHDLPAIWLPAVESEESSSSQPADLPGAPRMMSRASWVAAPPSGPLDNNTLPIQRVIVCHTAADACYTTPDCILKVRYVQQFHEESRKWNDIGYNFLVGGDGCVYVGRGWDKMGAHTKGHNNGTLGVAFIGNFVQQTPNALQIEAFHKLVDVGVRINKISENYTLVAQCQLQVTAAPGLALVRNMTSWPHFDSDLPVRCS